MFDFRLEHFKIQEIGILIARIDCIDQVGAEAEAVDYNKEPVAHLVVDMRSAEQRQEVKHKKQGIGVADGRGGKKQRALKEHPDFGEGPAGGVEAPILEQERHRTQYVQGIEEQYVAKKADDVLN